MENPQMTEKEKLLWQQAKKRVGFRKKLFSYIIVNAFLWALWYFTDYRENGHDYPFPWPIWPLLGWGMGLAFGYYDAYHVNKADAVEREFEKLKNSGK